MVVWLGEGACLRRSLRLDGSTCGRQDDNEYGDPNWSVKSALRDLVVTIEGFGGDPHVDLPGEKKRMGRLLAIALDNECGGSATDHAFRFRLWLREAMSCLRSWKED
jgi:hypothetical protein